MVRSAAGLPLGPALPARRARMKRSQSRCESVLALRCFPKNRRNIFIVARSCFWVPFALVGVASSSPAHVWRAPYRSARRVRRRHGTVRHLAFPEATTAVMLAERTFWEKATSMHVYCLQGRVRGERWSRTFLPSGRWPSPPSSDYPPTCWPPPAACFLPAVNSRRIFATASNGPSGGGLRFRRCSRSCSSASAVSDKPVWTVRTHAPHRPPDVLTRLGTLGLSFPIAARRAGRDLACNASIGLAFVPPKGGMDHGKHHDPKP